MDVEIQIKNLRKKYSNGTEALKGVDLDIGQGELFALLGPNGSGKSTLVKILTTLVRKDTGSFTVGGINPERNFALIQKLCGVASQENDLDPGETVFSLLQFQGELFGLSRKQSHDRAEEMMDLFRLHSERSKKAGTLSGGNKRRLHCALALVHKPRILFLDEPTVGMDPLARHTFWEIISQLNRTERVTIFLTTQYLDEADKHATSMAMIVNGEIRFAGEVNEFKRMVSPGKNATLEENYLAYIQSLTNQNYSYE